MHRSNPPIDMYMHVQRDYPGFKWPTRLLRRLSGIWRLCYSFASAKAFNLSISCTDTEIDVFLHIYKNIQTFYVASMETYSIGYRGAHFTICVRHNRIQNRPMDESYFPRRRTIYDSAHHSDQDIFFDEWCHRNPCIFGQEFSPKIPDHTDRT